MHESEDELRALETLLSESHRKAGPHLRSVFGDAARPSAAELAQRLSSIFEMHLATTTRDGAPLVAPLDGCFFKGKIWFGVPADSLRIHLLRSDPRVSASFTDGTFALIVHGVAREVTVDDAVFPDYAAYVQERCVAKHGAGWIAWRERNRQQIDAGYHAYIEARRLFAKR
jgi:hypothetical protein